MYTIAIGQYHACVEKHTYKTLLECKQGFRKEGFYIGDMGGCAVYVYDPSGEKINTINEGFFD